MTIEDFVLKFEGLDPARVKTVVDDVSHIMGILKTEMPRIERLINNLQLQIAAYEAKQKEFGSG